MARKPERSSSAEVYSITAAHRSHAEEMRERMTRYAITMTIRTAGFVLLVVIHNPTRWIFGIAAIVLPYVAVVLANAGRERTQAPSTLIGHAQHAALSAPPAAGPTAAPGPTAPHTVPRPAPRPASHPG
jgi:hypothetical protein